MIEQKLLIGRYIELNTAPPAMAGPAAAGFQEVVRVVRHINESHYQATPLGNLALPPGAGVGLQIKNAFVLAGKNIAAQVDRQRTSATAVGAHAKAHRNFVWLEWLGGLVSEVRPQGVDVLTGPMSGCWITSYQRGGVRFVGHVGTVMNAGDPGTIAAKAAWNAFAAGVPPTQRGGFNPFNDWAGAVPAAQPGEAAPKFFALVTAADSYHTIVAYPQTAMPTRVRIAGIQNLRSSLPLVI